MAWLGRGSAIIGYVAYFLVVRWVVRRDFGFRLTPTNRLILLVSLASVGLVRLLGLAHLTDLRFPVAAGLALGFAFYAGISLVRGYGQKGDVAFVVASS